MKNRKFQTKEQRTAFNKARRLLGKKAFRAILDPGIVYKYEVSSVVGRFLRTGRTPKETLAAALLIREEIARVREMRKAFRSQRSPQYFNHPEGWVRIPYQLPAGNPKERLVRFQESQEAERKNVIVVRFLELLNARRVDSRAVIRLPAGAPWEQVTAEAWASRGDNYSRRCQFRMTYANVKITIPYDFESTVDDEGLAELDGLLTLAAQRISANGEETVWRARWARKTAGFKFFIEDGYIVREGEEYAHGKSVRSARSILSRRANESRLQEIESKLLDSVERHDLACLAEIRVAIEDSLAAGNCEEGTLAFRDRYFPGRDSATVREVLNASASFSGRKLAIAACIRAIRRSRHSMWKEVRS